MSSISSSNQISLISFQPLFQATEECLKHAENVNESSGKLSASMVPTKKIEEIARRKTAAFKSKNAADIAASICTSRCIKSLSGPTILKQQKDASSNSFPFNDKATKSGRESEILKNIIERLMSLFLLEGLSQPLNFLTRCTDELSLRTTLDYDPPFNNALSKVVSETKALKEILSKASTAATSNPQPLKETVVQSKLLTTLSRIRNVNLYLPAINDRFLVPGGVLSSDLNNMQHIVVLKEPILASRRINKQWLSIMYSEYDKELRTFFDNRYLLNDLVTLVSEYASNERFVNTVDFSGYHVEEHSKLHEEHAHSVYRSFSYLPQPINKSEAIRIVSKAKLRSCFPDYQFSDIHYNEHGIVVIAKPNLNLRCVTILWAAPNKEFILLSSETEADINVNVDINVTSDREMSFCKSSETRRHTKSVFRLNHSPTQRLDVSIL